MSAEKITLYKGLTIEELELLEPTEEREWGYTVWKCRCSCGNIVYASSKKLKRKTVISCGCKIRYRQWNQNLVGKKIGILTVDYLSDKKNSEGKRLWHLSCECGGETYLTTGDVNRSKKTSCGCQNKHYMRPIYGYKKGNLTAIKPTNKRDRNKSVIWECKCDCGNEVEVSEDDFVHGSQISCGCLKRKAQQQIATRKHYIDGTCIERLGQKPARSDNQSGICGVHLTKRGRYQVYIGICKKRLYLGTYDDKEEALGVRLKAVNKYHAPYIQNYLEEKAKEQKK